MKDTIRKDIQQKRCALTADDVREKSFLIKHRVFSLREFIEAETILFYVSYGNEVFTHDMIKESLVMNKQVVVPCTDVKKKQLIASNLFHWDECSPGAYHILEPRKECIRPVSVGAVDLIIVPAISFDCFGQRIGHGMGYYDKLLQKAIRTEKIGLAFELQLVEKIPAEIHDIRVDKIVTEKRVIVCREPR
jgi:5-formyltetrahydrofolate cyclo-ligase